MNVIPVNFGGLIDSSGYDYRKVTSKTNSGLDGATLWTFLGAALLSACGGGGSGGGSGIAGGGATSV